MSLDFLPRILPYDWREVERCEDGAAYASTHGLRVIFSEEQHEGKRWLHLSCSLAHRLPEWHELRDVKNLFIGPEKVAIQVLPKESMYVNIHPYVLHLWCCLDADVLPDFTKGSKSL